MEIKSLFDKLKQTKQVVSMKKSSGGKSEQLDVLTEGKKITALVKSKSEKKKAEQSKPKSKPANSNVVRRTTEEGFKIYTEVELGLQDENAGNTPDCPFDCDCCV